MTNPDPHAGNVRLESPGALLMLFAVLAAFFVAMAALADPAQAKILKVTSKKDSGRGSLRAAIEKAAPSGDVIVFAPEVRTITLTSGELDVDKNLTIRGPGANKLTISGNNDDYVGGVFYIDGVKTVRISGLTITEGDSYYGGGIENDGNLTLIKSVVRDNYADYGGGIYNEEVLTLIESVVSDNVADDEGGGINNYYGTLAVGRSTISGNRAADGGGIDSDTELPSEGPLKTTIFNSTISGNSISSSSGEGGGIRNNDGLTEIKNSTITKNTAPSGQGGGVASDGYSDDAVVVSSSIISDNPTGDAVVFFGSRNPFVSNDYNLIGYGNAAVAFTKGGDRKFVGTPGLGALAANGGFTKTHALLSGSPAINTGSPTSCPATDQRGAQRPFGGRCDKGSFEFGARP